MKIFSSSLVYILIIQTAYAQGQVETRTKLERHNCERSGGYWNGYDCERNSFAPPSQSPPNVGNIIVFNYCRDNVMLKVAPVIPEVEEEASFGWFDIQQQLFSKNDSSLSGVIKEGIERAAVKGIKLYSGDWTIEQMNDQKIYIHGIAVKSGYRWEGSKKLHNEDENIGFTTPDISTNANGDAEIYLCN